jgi:hypothetical protein
MFNLCIYYLKGIFKGEKQNVLIAPGVFSNHLCGHVLWMNILSAKPTPLPGFLWHYFNPADTYWPH